MMSKMIKTLALALSIAGVGAIRPSVFDFYVEPELGETGEVDKADPTGDGATEMAQVVSEFLQNKRSTVCTDAPEVVVTAVGPCTSSIVSGTEITCVLSFISGTQSANHKVQMVSPASGGYEFYFEFDKTQDQSDRNFCDGLFASSFVVDPNKGLLELSQNSTKLIKTGGWLGHAAELEYLRQKQIRKYGGVLSPDHAAFQIEVMYGILRTTYGQDPRSLEADYSTITGFTGGKGSARSSSDCFPEGGVKREAGGSMVTNQGECGSCWAHAASTVISDRLCLAGVQGVSGHGKDRTLSVQHVLSCAYFADQPNLQTGFMEKSDPCTGGLAGLYYDFAKDRGVARSKDSPYTMKCPRKKANPGAVVAPELWGIACQTSELVDDPGMSDVPCACINQNSRPTNHPSCAQATQNVQAVYKIQGDLRMPYPGEWLAGKLWSIADIVLLYKQELFANGPFFVGFKTDEDFQWFWKERAVHIHNPRSEHRGGHAVALTGWGRTTQKPYPWQCRRGGGGGMTIPLAAPDTPSQVPDEANYVYDCNQDITVNYWELRNSWGSSWGNNGYFYMRSGYNECGLESSGRVPMVDPSTAGPHVVASNHGGGIGGGLYGPQPGSINKRDPVKCGTLRGGCLQGSTFWMTTNFPNVNEQNCQGTWCP